MKGRGMGGRGQGQFEGIVLVFYMYTIAFAAML